MTLTMGPNTRRSMTFLDQNGYELTCSSDELIEFGYEVAGGVRDRDSARKWFQENSERKGG